MLGKVLIGLVFLGFFASCGSNPEAKNNDIFCDAETIVEVEGNKKFICQEEIFDGGRFQTNEVAFSGKYALKLDTVNPVGFSFKLDDFEEGDAFYVSVWKKGEGKIHVKTNHIMDYYGGYVVEEKAGWEKLVFQFMVPPYDNQNEIIFEVVQIGNSPCYFDDFKIEKRFQEGLIYPEYENKNNVNLLLSDSSINILKKIRKEAFRKGILVTQEDSWVKGKLVFNEDTLTIELRLKGDWLDHLKDDKWSFRVKVKNGNVLNMDEFSLQTPYSRDFLSEYVYHDLLQNEDLLTTRYEFIPLKLNGKSLGIYALEQHFTSSLLEQQNRREGPMARFDESGFWNIQYYQEKHDTSIGFIYPFFNASRIKPFSKKKTRKDENLFKQFVFFQNNLNAYRHFELASSDCFDVEAYAKYYVLTDIFKAYHGLTWHNQRFYFNPITKKIEPIVFDAFTTEGSMKFSERPILAYNGGNYKANYFYELQFIYHAFNDASFRETYFKYLNYYLYEFDWTSYFKSIDKGIKERESLIKKEFLEYDYDRAKLLDRINELKKAIDTINYDSSGNNWFNFESFRTYRKNNPNDPNIPQTEMLENPISGTSFFVYTEKVSDKKHIKFVNYHHKPIEVIGIGETEGDIEKITTINLKQWQNETPFIYDLKRVGNKIKYVKYRLKNSEQTYLSKIIPYPYPNKTKAENITHAGPFENIKDSLWLLKKGEYTITKTVEIPNSIKLEIEPGAAINIKNKASLIIQTNLEVDSLRIYSSDNTGNIQFISVPEKLTITNCVFESLAITKNNFITGAVTVYKSDVLFKNCQFKNLKAEDGLNIINSHYELENCSFSNCDSDGVDIDFGKGKLKNILIDKTGNDGLDLSKTQIEIENLTITNAGDKAISIGENSDVLAVHVSVKGAVVGIANKDQSRLVVDRVTLSQTDFGFVQFIKKRIYNAPEAYIKSLELNSNQTNFMLDERGILKLNNHYILTKGIINAEAFD